MRHRVVPYDGRFWLDSETGDLRRLLVRTGELSRSTGNCEAATTVDFGLMPIGGHESLVAEKSVFRVVRRDAVEQENVTTYAGCHEFLGESAVHFGDTAAEGKAEAPGAVAEHGESKGRKKSFPPGVRLTIRFEAAIDSTTSAAGDLVAAVARQKESRPKRRLLPDRGRAPAVPPDAIGKQLPHGAYEPLDCLRSGGTERAVDSLRSGYG